MAKPPGALQAPRLVPLGAGFVRPTARKRTAAAALVSVGTTRPGFARKIPLFRTPVVVILTPRRAILAPGPGAPFAPCLIFRHGAFFWKLIREGFHPGPAPSDRGWRPGSPARRQTFYSTL